MVAHPSKKAQTRKLDYSDCLFWLLQLVISKRGLDVDVCLFREDGIRVRRSVYQLMSQTNYTVVIRRRHAVLLVRTT